MWSSSSSSSLSSAALQVQPGPIPTTDPRASVVSGGFVGFSVALHSLLCFRSSFTTLNCSLGVLGAIV